LHHQGLTAPLAPRRMNPLSATRSLYVVHAVNACLRQRADTVHAIYVASARRDPRMRYLVTRAEAARLPVHSTDDDRLTALAGTSQHQGVVAMVDATAPHVTLDDVLETLTEPALLLVLDGVADPHNLGACLRNADAFGAHAGSVESLNVAVASGICLYAARRARRDKK